MSWKRFWNVFKQDLVYHWKRPLLWILVAILAFLSWGFSTGAMRISAGDSDVGGVKAFFNSEFAIAQQMIMIVALFYGFFLAVAAGLVIISDEEQKTGELLHATPLRVSEYIWGKFSAVMATFILVLVLNMVLSMFFFHVIPTAKFAEMRGPWLLRAYLRPALFLVLPNLIFLGGLSFAIGERTRKAILVFALPIMLFLLSIFFFWNWSPAWLPLKWNRLLMGLDPSGFRWFIETWSKVDRGAAFYNTARIGFDGPFLLSRLALVVLGLGSVAWSHARFQKEFRGEHAKAKDIRAALAPKDEESAVVAPITKPVRELAMTSGRLGILRGLWAVARFEVKGLLHQPGMYLFVPIIMLMTVSDSMVQVGAFSSEPLLTSGSMAVRGFGMLTTLLCFLFLFYGVESLSREKNVGLEGIFASTKVPTFSLLAGKALANSLVGAVILVANGFTCLVIQAVQGITPIQLWPFLLVWGLLMIPTFLVWTAFVNAVQALARNRYTTYAVGLGAIMVTGICLNMGWMNWAGNWPLWGILHWSDIGTFELDRSALVLNRLMVIALAFFFTALTAKVYARQERDATATLHRFRPKVLAMAGLRMLPYAALPLVLIITLMAKVGAGYQSGTQKKKDKDYWCKNVETYKDYPTPAITAVEMDLELDPAKRGFKVTGSYVLRNHRSFALEQIPVSVPSYFKDVVWTVDGQAFKSENRAGLHILTANGKALMPGVSIKVGFEYHGCYLEGFSKNGGGAGYFILPSGIVLGTDDIAPTLGFQEGIGIDKDNRTDPKEFKETWFEGVTPSLFGNDTDFTTRIRITGPADYTYNSVGVKVEDRLEGKKRSVLWVSDHPVSWFNVVAGRWKVQQGAGTAIYYHPGHAYNLKEMGEALDAARKYYSEWFYPFPWKELKLSEFPALATYGQGFATNITFSEGIGFLTKSDPKANVAFMVTAHEASHQWWGNILTPGKGPGGNVISEGLAHYSTVRLFEQVKGAQQRMAFLSNIESSYNDGRVPDSERSLVKLWGARPGERSITYDKGGWAFYMLSELMGREAFHAGLREFLKTYVNNPDHPVIQDLLPILRKQAPDAKAYDEFTQQWFYQVVVPEYKVSEASSTQRPDGSWDVKFRIRNEGSGRMPLCVAVVAKGDRYLEAKDALTPDKPNPEYRDSRINCTLSKGESQLLAVHCPFKPDSIVPDPDVQVLQLRRKQATLKL